MTGKPEVNWRNQAITLIEPPAEWQCSLTCLTSSSKISADDQPGYLLWLLGECYSPTNGGGSVIKVGGRNCPYCQRSFDIYVSRPRGLLEELAILLLLRPVRCHDCNQRFLRPLHIATPPPPVKIAKPTKSTTTVENRKDRAS